MLSGTISPSSIDKAYKKGFKREAGDLFACRPSISPLFFLS